MAMCEALVYPYVSSIRIQNNKFLYSTSLKKLIWKNWAHTSSFSVNTFIFLDKFQFYLFYLSFVWDHYLNWSVLADEQFEQT